MEERESSERKNLFIRTILIVILLLLAFLSTILYVYLYPKTRVYLYDTDYTPIRSFEVRRYSTLSALPDVEKSGYTFKYWTYDDFELNGGTILDKDAELTTESVSLYANYQANRYRVTYHVQYYDEVLGQYNYKTYIPPRQTYPEIYDYGTEIKALPNGRDAFGQLLPDFNNKPGYHFVGWTTRVVSEDDPTAKDEIKYAGQSYVIDIPSDIDFYAYFEKNTFTMNLHTGIQYDLDSSGNPKKDENGEYIIKNITGDTNNDKDSLIKDSVRYMDSLIGFAEKYSNITLSEKNGGMACDEYEFKGWYFDDNYTMPVRDQKFELKIKQNGRPYYEFEKDGVVIEILGEDTGNVDADGNTIYEFNMYSKWQRKAYEITFNKNSNSCNGKINPIYLYKVFLDEQGIIIDEYGKYYNDGEFTYDGYKNGGHYCKFNLSTLDVVDNDFRNSNKNYRLIAWSDNANSKTDGAKVYALWQQEPWTEELGKNRITGAVTYSNNIYVHDVSKDITLYAMWSKVYTIKFAYASGVSQKYFEMSGIEGEWFMLPNMADITRITGSEWTKKYNYFGGWSTGTSSLATKYLEKLTSGENNPNFKYTIARSSATLIVYWLKTPYEIKFYLNDGTDNVLTTYTSVFGGTYKYFPASPSREGYMFDGWSKTKYADNEYSIIKRKIRDNISVPAYDNCYTSSSNFLIDGDAVYYASWTTDFEVEYDANGGSFVGNAKTTYKYSENNTNNLKLSLYVGRGITVTKENFIFKGWKIKISDGEVADKLIKTSSTKRTTFDFYPIDGKYYYYDYKADGITVGANEKTEMSVLNGRKVVLVADWEPKKYNVKIVDTLANEGETASIRTDVVAFNERYVFPKTNSLGEIYDSKIGYKLIGFATTKGGEATYLIDNNGEYPYIEANTISANMTFYTVYQQKNISIVYKAIMPDDSIIAFDEYSTVVAYGAPITLPVKSSVIFNSKELKFKYWYYVNAKGEEVKLVSGDKASYHNENDVLEIFGKFEAESYEIKLGITNPFTNENQVIEIIPAFDNGYSIEKNTTITQAIYNEVMNRLYAKLSEIFGDQLIGYNDESGIVVILKGYTLSGLYASGGYDDKFEINKKFDSANFTILGFTTDGMTLVTRWNANPVDIVYHASEEDGANQTIDSSNNFKSTIVLKDSSYVDVGSGKIVNSWYIIDGDNKLFFDCSSTLAGVGGKYANLYALAKFITWDSNGKGTLNIYANTKQECVVEYYSFDGAQISKVQTQSFIWGDKVSILSGDIALIGIFAGSDARFEGWYYKGQKVISVPVMNDETGYTIKLYANLTINKSLYYIKVNGSVISEELLSSETINLLTYTEYPDGRSLYMYLTSITIKSCPELTSDQIPSGYDYYGLRYGDKTYKKSDIESDGITIAITGENIKFVTYYTKEYTLTYQVNDGATFDDNTTDDRILKYLIGIDSVVAETNDGKIRIMYSAKKVGYDNCFMGWQVKQSNGALSDKIYALNEEFSPTQLSTVLVPYFKTPDAHTIDVKIVLIKSSGSTERHEGKYLTPTGVPSEESVGNTPITNGDKFVFTGSDGVSDVWTSPTADLYKWVGEDGKEYNIGDYFEIPLACVSEQEFVFTGIWIDKYVATFTQPNEYKMATNYDERLTLYKGREYKLTKTPEIYVDGQKVEGVEFKYWTIVIGGETIEINIGDTIVLNRNDSTTYTYSGNIDGSVTHYLPKLDNSNNYEFLGVWDSVTYDITLVVTNPDNNNDYTLTLFDVPFGTTIGNRDMFSSNYIYLFKDGSITTDNANNLNSILALENEDRGIVGWSLTKGGEQVQGILNSISKSMTLYACFQTKYTLTFADASGIEYDSSISAINGSKHLPSDVIKLDNLNNVNVIKNIYASGYSTVYFENGKYIVVKASGNDYYIVTGFTSNVDVLVNNIATKNIGFDANGKIENFEMPSSNVILTPVVSRTYKVTFKDNTNADGGNEILDSDNNIKYLEFLKANETLKLSGYTHTRTNFTFIGWNTNKDSDVALDSVTATNQNIELYSIWASNRRARFQVSLTSSSGITNTVLFEFPLNKDNKINKNIIEMYLAGNLTANNNTVIYGKLDKNEYLQSLSHPAYTYNFKNYYLDGFTIVKNGSEYTWDIDTLCSEDFGSSDYNQNENVLVTFNLNDIFTVSYNSSASDLIGTINSNDYFVTISSSKIGKLVSNGGFETLQLQKPTVTRNHYVAKAYSTDETVQSSSMTFAIPDDLTLTNSKLSSIANSLKNKYLQELQLYIVWDFEPISTYIYAVANVVDSTLTENENVAETTLLNPYNAYLNGSADGSTIAFKNIPNIIMKNGVRIIAVGNYSYNTSTPAIAELKYNDVFTLGRSDLTLTDGFTLIGFSKTLFKLGQSVNDNEYFKLGTEITLTEEILTDNKLVLYPVYSYITKTVSVYTRNGDVEVISKFAITDADGNLLNNNNSGFVSIENNGETNTVTVANDDSKKDFDVNYFTTLTLNAIACVEGYNFDNFVTDSAVSDMYSITGNSSCRIDGNKLFTESLNIYSSYSIMAVFSASPVKVNVTLNYGDYTLKAGYTDNGKLLFTTYSNIGNRLITNIDSTNLLAEIKTTTLGEIEYRLDTTSDYYNYTLYNDGQVINLKSGYIIEISKLNLSDTKDSDGNYVANIQIVATPKTYNISFVMNRGVFNSDAEILATSDIFENVKSFAIVSNSAKVFIGSNITLPGKDSITYLKGRFEKFYLNGDPDKAQVLETTVNSDLTFVEGFDDNAYSIQYVYNGKVEIVSGITPGDTIEIGVESARNVEGYTLKYWAFENGEKAFDDKQQVEINKSYILIAVYSGNEITYKYNYDGGSYLTYGNNGEDITLISTENLADATIYDDKYIYGWQYGDLVFKASETVKFTDLKYVYVVDGENVITFTAVYYKQYKYTISYVTSDANNGELINASEFADTYAFIRTTNATGTTINENDLKFKISDITPKYEDSKSLYFDKYTVEYTLDGSTWIAQNVSLLVGGILNLITPTQNVTYRLTPTFKSTNTIVNIEYVITSPVDEGIINSDWNNISFNAGANLGDEYLLNLVATKGSSDAEIILTAMGLTKTVNVNGLDWFEYSLNKFKVELYIGDNLSETREFYIGNEVNENRNFSGASKVVITTIWTQKFVVNYHDLNGNVIEKDYIDYDSSSIFVSTLGADIYNNISKDGYTLVGFTKETTCVVTENSQIIGFESEIEVGANRIINLYPAMSKNYTLKFVTTGIDDSDVSEFVFNQNITLPVIYVGINSDNSIDLANYKLDSVYFDYTDATKLYSLYNDTKYTFVGFANAIDGIAGKNYILNTNLISGNEVTVYAVWQKNNYNVNFVFEYLDNSNNKVNKLTGYSYVANSYYGDQINLSNTYNLDTNTFNFANTISNSDGLSLQDKINAIISEQKLDYYSHITFVRMVNGASENIDTSKLFDIFGQEDIKVVFDTPIYRLSYFAYLGMKFDGKEVDDNGEVLLSKVINLGDNLTCDIDISRIELTGLNVDFWSNDGDNNFFDGGNHIVTDDDLKNANASYIIYLLPHYSTDYMLNFYYLSSLSDLQNYEKAKENNESDAKKYYTQLGSTINLKVGKYIGLYLEDEDGNYVYDDNFDLTKIYKDESKNVQATIFDSLFDSGNIEIVLDASNNIKKTITSFADLFTVFEDYEYTTEGEVNVNDVATNIALEIDGHMHYSLYSARTYGGDVSPLVNNVYLVYEKIEHNVKLFSSVVEYDGENYILNRDLASKYNVYGEYATTLKQLEDTGDDSVAIEDTVNLASSINSNYISNKSVTFTDKLYLINSPYFVRGGKNMNTSFDFVSWKVLDSEIVSGVNEYVLKDISECGISVTPHIDGDTLSIKYWEITGITKDIQLVAVFTRKMVNVTINMTSLDNNADLLKLNVVSDYSGDLTDYSSLESVILRDSTNHVLTYNFDVIYNSWLLVDVFSELKDSYKIGKITIGSYEKNGSVYLAINENNIDSNGNIVINVYLTQLTYSMYLKTEQYIDGTRYYGELNSVGYRVGSIEASNDTTLSGGEFNYMVEIPVGATLDASIFGMPILNNYTCSGYEILDTDGSWKTLTSVAVKNIVNDNNEIYVRVIYTPNDITIKYVLEQTNGSDTIQNELTELTTTAKYGTQITLPYVVLQSDDFVTVGWDKGNFGSTIKVITLLNDSVTEFVIKLTKKDLYHVVFDKGDTSFTIPNAYPSDNREDNIVIDGVVSIPANTEYYYNKISSNVNIGSKLKNASDIILVGNTYLIPTDEIADVDGEVFDGWKSNLNKIYKSGSIYTLNTSDVYNNQVKLTATLSNYLSIKFYMTNPKDSSQNYMLSTKTTSTANIEYISLLVDKDYNNNYVDVDYSNSNSEFLKVNAMQNAEISLSYFVNANLMDNYKFYGWSTTPISSFANILDILNSSDNFDNSSTPSYYSYYSITNGVCTKKAYQVITKEFIEFVKNSGKKEFYPIWEQKFEVSFVLDDGQVYRAKTYGMGELVEFPNAQELTLTNANKKWIGWKSQNSKVEFVNGKASIYFGGIANVTYTPLWEDGYTLTFDTNFDRNTISSIFAKYGATNSEVLNGMAYPYFTKQFANLVGSGSPIEKDINGETKTTYPKYTYSSLITANETIDISSYALTDNYVYPVSIEMSMGTWQNSYYIFAGWSLTENGKVLTSDELQAFSMNSKNVTLYAIWTPVEFNIYLCSTKENAEQGKGILSSSNVNNPLKVAFGSYFDVSTISTSEYISNFDYFKNQKNKRFSNWNAVSPLNYEFISQTGGIPVINNIYLYADYTSEYTVLFKTSKGVMFAGQGENKENCQKVVDGERVSIKDYIENTLGQNMNFVSSIYYTNNGGNNTEIDKNTSYITFVSSMLSMADQENLTFTIYLNVEFTVNLYAPKNNADTTFEIKKTLDITPDYTMTVKSSLTYSDEYKLDLSIYENNPEFVGWFYYSDEDSQNVYSIKDLSSSIYSYKITSIDGQYKLVTYNANNDELVYDLSDSLIINLYAKLKITQKVSLGDDNDNIIQKYAKLSFVESDYAYIENSGLIDNISTNTRDVKYIVVSTIYGSPRQITFLLESTGYILSDLKSSNANLDFVAQNEKLVDTQNFDIDAYILSVQKSTVTTQSINGVETSGLYLTYTLTLQKIKENGEFNLYISPFTFDVSYKVNDEDGILKIKSSLTDTPKDYLDSSSIELFADINIYQTRINNGNVSSFEANSYLVEYTAESIDSVTNITYKSVPYGMSISLRYLPVDDMYKHFSSLTFDWSETVWFDELKKGGVSISSPDENAYDQNEKVSSVEIYESNGEKITYRPVENNSTVMTTNYTVTVNFVENVIKEIKLYLDFDKTSDSDTPWTNALDKNIQNHDKQVSKFTGTNGTTYDKYSIYWEVGAREVNAGSNIVSRTVEWKNNFHNDFENTLNSEEISDIQNSLGKVMNYFTLLDSSVFKTYSKEKLDKSVSGYFDGSQIYSQHLGTVNLHIDLDRAMLVQASTRTINYLNELEISSVQRANIAMSTENNVKVYDKNNTLQSYENNTFVDNLLVKAVYGDDLNFTVSPLSANNDHVEYILKEWSALNDATVDTGVKRENNTIYLNTSIANNSVVDMFAEFGSVDKYRLPEIHLRADVVAKTFNINFRNDDGKTISTLTVAYDKEIADLDGGNVYPYYAYNLNTLKASTVHNIPTFMLDAKVEGIKFVHSSDDSGDKYGDLKYVFNYWSLAKSGIIFANENTLINRTISGGEYSYNDITLYAVYTACQDITFVKYATPENDTFTLYLAPTGFSDQFGNTYDNSLLSSNYSLNDWINKYSNVSSDTAGVEYYLKGVDNYTNIKVSTLKDIENAYINNANSLVDVNKFIVYPKIFIELEIFEHMLDPRYSRFTTTFATLGGKIDFDVERANGQYVASSKNLVLSNIVLESSQSSMLSPKDYSDYTFALWYVNNNYVNIENSRSVYVNSKVYPHYNSKVIIQSSAYGSTSILKGTGDKYNVGDWLPILDVPSFRYITTTTHDLRENISLNYETMAVDESGYTYAVLKIVDNTLNTTIYTIKYVANDKIFDRIAFNIITQSGMSVTLESMGKNMYMDDGLLSFQVYPVAFPDEVKITVENFAIVNLPNESQYSGAFSMSASSVTIQGGAEFIKTSTANKQTLTFKRLNGDMDSASITATTTTIYTTNNLGLYLQNYRWQYKQGAKWIDCGENMYAFGDLTIRLVADWITYNISFERMFDLDANIDSVMVDGSAWKVLDKDYSAYTITDGNTTITNFVMYKGETLSYDKANTQFVVTSSIGSRMNYTIYLSTNGYIMGFLSKTVSGNNVMLDAMLEDISFDDVKDRYFVAWVENEKTLTVSVDQNTDYVYGYGEVSYVISNPMGRNDDAKDFALNKNSKTYGTLIVGASTKVSIIAKESAGNNHDLKSIKFSGDKSITKIDTISFTANDYAGNMRTDISILYDAEDTLTQVYVANVENYILNTYNMYGGYSIEYIESQNVITASVINYWGILADKFTIYKMQNGSNTSNEFYPTPNRYIENVNISVVDNVTTNNKNYITSSVKAGSKIEDGATTYYTGDKNKYVILFDEYVHTVELTYRVTDGSTTFNTLGSNSAYVNVSKIKNTQTLCSNGDQNAMYRTTIQISKNDRTGAINYDLTKGGIQLNIGNNFVGYVVPGVDSTTNASYKLKEVRITNNLQTVAMVEYLESSIAIPVGSVENWDIDKTSYTVEVLLEKITEVKVSFKLTLPNSSDLRNLFVKADGSTISFNDNSSITMVVGTKVKVSGNTVYFVNTSNQTVLTVSYENSKIYNVKGWFVDSEYNHSDITSVDSYSIGGVAYDLLKFTPSVNLNEKDAVLTKDCTIVLSADRLEQKLYIDNLSWKTMDKSNIKDNELYMLESNYTLPSTPTYTFPSGLVKLKPVYTSQIFYTVGVSSYIGRNNVECPVVLNDYRLISDEKGNNFELTIGDSNYTIKNSGNYARSGYSVLSLDNTHNTNTTNVYDIELTNALTWVLVEFPANSTDDIVNIRFHSFELEASTPEDSTTLSFYKNNAYELSLPSFQMTDNIASIYAYKSIYTTLYSLVTNSVQSDYAYYNQTTLLVNTNGKYANAMSLGTKCILSSYKVVYNGVTTETRSLNLSEYSGTIDVYPIFVERERYTIVLSTDIDRIPERHEVFENDLFYLNVSLDAISLSKNGSGIQATYQTIMSKDSSKVLMGMVVESGTGYLADANGNKISDFSAGDEIYNLLYVNKNELYQRNSTLVFSLVPTSDIVIVPNWSNVNTIEFNFTCTNYDDYSNLDFAKYQTVYIYNILEEMTYITPSPSLDPDSAYFRIDEVTEVGTQINYTVDHNHCNMVPSDYTDWSGCYEYYTEECTYCGYTSIDTSNPTGNTNHKMKSEICQDGANGHYTRTWCENGCGLSRQTDVTAHSYNWEIRSSSSTSDSDANSSYHYYDGTCSVCGYTTTKTETHNWTNTQYYWNVTGSPVYKNNESSYYCYNTVRSTSTCSDCGATKSELTGITGNAHKYSGWKVEEDSVVHYQNCIYCGNKSALSIGHSMEYKKVNETQHEGTCTKCGYKERRNHVYDNNGKWCTICLYAPAHEHNMRGTPYIDKTDDRYDLITCPSFVKTNLSGRRGYYTCTCGEKMDEFDYRSDATNNGHVLVKIGEDYQLINYGYKLKAVYYDICKCDCGFTKNIKNGKEKDDYKLDS